MMFAGLAWGCSQTPEFVASYEPWRDEEERACLAAGYVRTTPFIQARTALGGPSVCGALQPFAMTAADQGRITLQPPALLRCSMIPVVDRWVKQVVEPAARMYLGAPLTEVRILGSYSCRPMNGQWGARLSEHGHANAVDVSEFRLADGRAVAVKSGWNGNPAERAFLRSVHDGACVEFSTVLGPDYNDFHHDHFHLDMARRGADGAGQVCK
jgi:hypothetical protein